MRLSRTLSRLICSLFLLIGVACFMLRGPGKMLKRSNDFATIFSASRAFALGHDPYDQMMMVRMWLDAGGPPDRAPTPQFGPSVYTPSTSLLVAPLAILPWKVAQLIWFGISMLWIIVLMMVFRRLLGCNWTDNRMLLFAGFAVGLRPFASSISVGQLSIAVTGLATLGVLFDSPAGGRLSGLLYGLAISLKAPVGALFLLPGIIARRWKLIASTLIVVLILNGIGIVRLGSPSGWYPHWMENLNRSISSGGVNDPSPANPTRLQMLNLQYPLYSMVSNPLLIKAITWGIAIFLAIPAMIALRKKPVGADLLLPLACLCTLDLLAIYHRTYDGTLLIFPLAWALLPTTPVWKAGPVLAILLVFLAPGASVPPDAHHPTITQILLLARDAWAVLCISAWLAVCLWIDFAPGRRSSGG